MLRTRGRGLWNLPVIMVAGAMLLAGPWVEQADAQTKAQRIERNLTNKERKVRVQRPRVRLDKQLSRIARRHSRRMANRGVLHHNPNLARQLRHREWSVVGENVGVAGKVGSLRRSLRMLHDAFMKSRPHRRNIVYNRYRRMGVGLVRDSGRIWLTVVFMG